MTVVLLAVGLVLAAAPFIEPTIIRRHDRPDSAYVALGRQHPAVGSVGKLGDGTLVGAQWLLTAGHVARAAERGKPAVRIAGQLYSIAQVWVHPRWQPMASHDIGVIRLDRPVPGVQPVRLNRRRDERGRIATIVGHGGSGTGADRARTEDGLARAATTAIDSADADWIYFSFDAPPTGTAFEGAPGPGDSGGPALIRIADTVFVAGVSSAGYDGAAGPGTYGAIDVFTRVSTHAGWVDSVIAGTLSTVVHTRDTIPPATAALPDTPAGTRVSAFVAAMREGTDSAIVSFLRANFSRDELAARSAEARLPNFRRLAAELQGISAKRVLASAAAAITVEFATDSSGVVTIEFVCEPSPPHGIVDWRRYDR